MITTTHIAIIAVILFILALFAIAVRYSDLGLGILAMFLMSIFILGSTGYAISAKCDNAYLTRAQHTLEQFSSYEEIYTGALTGSKIDVFDRGDRKDVCITIPTSDFGSWRQYYFHVRPDLSYEHYEP